MISILQKLKIWRDKTALKEGVEGYRVLSNQTIEAISLSKPKTKEELLLVKGIKEKRFERYGQEILSIVLGGVSEQNNFLNQQKENNSPNTYSVSLYLSVINGKLRDCEARVKGEISSLDIRDNYLFFSLKDKDDKSLLSCFMWRNNYQISGVALEEGMEIIVSGFSEVHKPTGKFTFRTSSVELAGIGALKAAYEDLKKKLETEGLFDPARKRPIPSFPQRIGVITSKDGAAIGDFLANIGKFGFKIFLLDSRVEGQLATKELLASLKTFRRRHKEIDVLVLMRGGGSFESLLPFNNETLVREIASFPVPVLCGVGHEKDISLAALVADRMVSTPTAAAETLNESWRKVEQKIEYGEKRIFSIFEKRLLENQSYLNHSLSLMKDSFHRIFDKFRQLEESYKQFFISLRRRFFEINKNLVEYLNVFLKNFKESVLRLREGVLNSEKLLQTNNPERQLSLGYSIVRTKKGVVRSVKDIEMGDEVNVKVVNGDFDSKIIKINP